MYALNRAQIIGYLTQDPEVRQTSTGQTVGNLNIMTKSNIVKADGETQEMSSYHNIVVWRGLAEVCGQYLKAGSCVYVSGRAETDSWEDDSGAKQYKTKITAEDMIMLDSKSGPSADLPQGSTLGTCLNKVEVIGNLTKDPETRETPNGSSVTNISVATSVSWKSNGGESQEKTEYHNIVVWNKLAQDAAQALTKGRKVYITGRHQTRSWETPEGKKRYTTEIVADSILAVGVAVDMPQQLATQSAPRAETKAAAASGEITSDMIPDINYESDVKPEDLPF